jgi:hypothetical protein
VISINSSVWELEMQQRNRELERKAEHRRRLDEMVHAPVQTRKNQGRIRTLIAGVRGVGGLL